ncbi:MAG: hypothetical protein OJF49_004303 [Ktedonobacterales bacterium]|nr:MAG: hypothetical protein OJF49_004303 [Ktedonobacterales bacterium]
MKAEWIAGPGLARRELWAMAAGSFGLGLLTGGVALALALMTNEPAFPESGPDVARYCVAVAALPTLAVVVTVARDWRRGEVRGAGDWLRRIGATLLVAGILPLVAGLLGTDAVVRVLAGYLLAPCLVSLAAAFTFAAPERRSTDDTDDTEDAMGGLGARHAPLQMGLGLLAFLGYFAPTLGYMLVSTVGRAIHPPTGCASCVTAGQSAGLGTLFLVIVLGLGVCAGSLVGLWGAWLRGSVI